MQPRRLDEAGYAFPEIAAAAAAEGRRHGEAAAPFRRTAPGQAVCGGLGPPGAARRKTPADLEQEAYCRGFSDGEQSGFARGEAAGRERAAAELAPLLSSLKGILAELEGLRERVVRGAEEEIVRFALEVARRVVGREARSGTEVVGAIVSGVLGRLEHAERITLRLNPEDLERLKRSQAELVAAWTRGGRVRLEADPAVTAGGCLADSDCGDIDARLERCFAVVEKALLGERASPAPPEG